MAFAFGEMGMTPDQFFDMLPLHYYDKVEGYNKKIERERKYNAEILRQSVFASLGSWEGQISYGSWCQRFFPLWFDKVEEKQIPTLSAEQMEAAKNRHLAIAGKAKKPKKKK